MTLPTTNSSIATILAPDIRYWEIDALVHFANRIGSRAGAEANLIRAQMLDLEKKKDNDAKN